MHTARRVCMYANAVLVSTPAADCSGCSRSAQLSESHIVILYHSPPSEPIREEAPHLIHCCFGSGALL
jgi:hypothetical protein